MVFKNWIISSILLFGCFDTFAKPTPADCNNPSELDNQAGVLLAVASTLNSEGCADATKLHGICDSVYMQFDAPKGSGYEYLFEKKIYEASCAKLTDSEAVINKKIKTMWAKLENPHLKCDQANFDVSYGSILKYGLITNNYDFLGLAIEEWGVNLNIVDKNDSRTLLDYIQKEIDRKKGSSFEGPLRDYYKRLRKYGAKHKSEL
ncbi:MAG TPA: hypothetical protein VNJ08_14280 [Bacteriovoracaceae bacterium]|nr:hypothetical protein [Bacteriovoracaceae bacterium]